jgi:predicted phage tail component-like protein
MIGFTFCGKHSSQFNIGVRSVDRSAIPERRNNEVIIPGRDGTVDFDQNTYGKRVISVTIALVKNKSYPELRQMVRKIAGWLSDKGPLIFDDEPNLSYRASVYGYAGIDQFVGLPAGIVDITFECQPFAEDADPKQSVNDISASPTTINIESAGTVDAPCIIYVKNNGASNITAINLTRKAAK